MTLLNENKRSNNNLTQDKPININIMFISSCHSPGKTTVIRRLTEGYYKPPSSGTIGIDFTRVNYEYDKKNYKLSFWDTPGIRSYKNTIYTYLKGCNFFIYLFDLK